MAGKAPRWLMGCGVGCAVVVLILVVLGFMGFFWVSETFEGVGKAQASREELEERDGPTEDFVPAADGAIPAARLDLFLSVRHQLREDQAGLEALFADFPPDEVLDGSGAFRKVMAVLGSLADLIGPIGEYVDQRNNLLLESDMGLGEYLYVYSMAYYSWLGRSPEDGPMVTKGKDRGESPERLFGGDDSPFGPDDVRRRHRRLIFALLSNQLAAAGENEPWRSELSAEIGYFERRPDAVAWERGLPEPLAASLEPYRSELEATYDATSNCFEFPPPDDEDWGKWRFEGD